MNHAKHLIAVAVVWLKGEPVVASVLAADALTAAARFGIHLDAGNTLVVGALASAVAAWAARSLVTPAANAAPVAAGDVERLLEETAVAGQRLGRHVRLDARSLRYLARDLVDATQPPTSRLWPFPGRPLNQGHIGSCTGNATTHLLRVRRGKATGLAEKTALAVYERATQIDKVAGAYPPNDTGSTGLDALHAAQELGLFTGAYRWCLGLQDVLQVLSQHGPVIIGIPWYSGFDNPGADGLLKIGGAVRGGHEVCLHGVNVEERTVTGVNSWGPKWGPIGGHFKFDFDTLDRLLHEHGDAATVE